MKICTDNIVERAVTLEASSAASASLAVANLISRGKSSAWRATGTTAYVRAAWTVPEALGFAGLAFTNLSPTTQGRIRVSTEVAATNLKIYSETGFFWTAAGTLSPPIVRSNYMYDGVMCGRISFTVGMTASFTNCRAIPGGAHASTLAGLQYCGSAYISLSRALTGSESVVIWCTGTAAGSTLTLTSANSAAYVGTLVRVLFAPFTGALGSMNVYVYLGSAVSSTVHVYCTKVQFVQEATHTSYYPSTDAFVSRATTGTYIDASGNIATAGINVARMTYDPNDLTADPKLLIEGTGINHARGSQTLSTANGWVGPCSSTVHASTYRGIPYVTVAKTTAGTSEVRQCPVWVVTAGQTYTTVVALRAGSVDTLALGLQGSVELWGANDAFSYAQIEEGPGTITRSSGAFYIVAGLSASVDTLVRITRLFVSAQNGMVSLYPGTHLSNVIGDSILATRVSAELGTQVGSYMPTTTVAVTRSNDVHTSVSGVRPPGFIDDIQEYNYDSGTISVCPVAAVTLRGYTPTQAASAYAYGGVCLSLASK